MNQQPEQARSCLQVAARKVYRSDGKAISEMRVFCPDRDHLVGIDECIGCAHWGSLHLERRVRTSFVRCSPRNPAPQRNQGRVSSIMTLDVVCLRPDLSAIAAVDVFLEHGLSAAPVVDREGRLLGFLSRADLLRAKQSSGPAEDGEPASESVEDLMTPLVVVIQQTATIPEAAALMAAERVHHLLVVSPHRELIGILSTLDVLRWLGERDGLLSPTPTLMQDGTPVALELEKTNGAI